MTGALTLQNLLAITPLTTVPLFSSISDAMDAARRNDQIESANGRPPPYHIFLFYTLSSIRTIKPLVFDTGVVPGELGNRVYFASAEARITVVFPRNMVVRVGADDLTWVRCSRFGRADACCPRCAPHRSP